MSLVTKTILQSAVIGSVLIAIYLFTLFKKGKPVARPFSYSMLAPYAIFLFALGIIGGLSHWAGIMDKVPFIYLGFIYPAIVLHISIRLQNTLTVTKIGALLGSLVMLASFLIRVESGLFLFILTTGAQGIVIGYLATLALKSETLKSSESWVVSTVSLIAIQWAGVVTAVVILAGFGMRG
jgi:hypothetical protein